MSAARQRFRSMRYSSRLPVLAGLFAVLQSGLAPGSPDTIGDSIRPVHRPPVAFIWPLQTMLGGTIDVTPADDRILLAGPDAARRAARDLVAKIDHPPEMLLVTVLKTTDVRKAAKLTGNQQASSSGQKTTRRIFATGRITEDGDLAQVRVLEGHPAYLRYGRSGPGPGFLWLEVRRRRTVVDTALAANDPGDGFRVRAELVDDQVLVEIHHQSGDDRPAGGTLNAIHELGTTLTGRTGTWLDAGGLSHPAATMRGSGTASTFRSHEDGSRLLLRVDRVN